MVEEKDDGPALEGDLIDTDWMVVARQGAWPDSTLDGPPLMRSHGRPREQMPLGVCVTDGCLELSLGDKRVRLSPSQTQDFLHAVRRAAAQIQMGLALSDNYEPPR